MRRTNRTSLVAALVAAFGMLMANFAYASTVDVSVVDIIAPTGAVSVTAGGSTAPIQINASITGNQDGTATFEVYKTWVLNSAGVFVGSDPHEFTVSPRNGGDPATLLSVAGTVSAAADAPVSTTAKTLSVGATDITNSNANGGKLAAGSTGTYSVTVQAPVVSNTAPVVTVSGRADDATYEFGNVPAVSCNVSDAEDTNESATPQVSAITGPLASFGLGSQTVACSYTDAGGLSDSDSVTYTIVDTGAPVITDEGFDSGTAGSNGWYTSAVTNEFKASDSGAGFVALTNPHYFTKSSGTDEGGAVTIGSGTVSDVAGNTATAINSAAYKIDLSNPYNVTFSGGPAAGSTHYFGSVPAAPSCTADDDISQLANCQVSGHSTAIGSHTMTATATDNAGRTATAQSSYTVLAWTLQGFYRPVDAGILNTAKAGSTVPLKFEAFAGTTELTSTSVVDTFVMRTVNCSNLETTFTDAIETYSTGGTTLRYDTTGGQFVQNWQTPKAPGNCYKVVLTLDDGSTTDALFKLK